MKKILLSSAFLLMCFLGTSQENKLLGKWVNSAEKNEGEQFEFKKDQTAIMTKEGIDSPPFKYVFNDSKIPNWVDLTVDEDDFKMTMHGLVEFIDKNTLKLELFPENKETIRQAKFTPPTETNEAAYVILKRI